MHTARTNPIRSREHACEHAASTRLGRVQRRTPKQRAQGVEAVRDSELDSTRCTLACRSRQTRNKTYIHSPQPHQQKYGIINRTSPAGRDTAQPAGSGGSSGGSLSPAGCSGTCGGCSRHACPPQQRSIAPAPSAGRRAYCGPGLPAPMSATGTGRGGGSRRRAALARHLTWVGLVTWVGEEANRETLYGLAEEGGLGELVDPEGDGRRRH